MSTTREAWNHYRRLVANGTPRDAARASARRLAIMIASAAR